MAGAILHAQKTGKGPGRIPVRRILLSNLSSQEIGPRDNLLISRL